MAFHLALHCWLKYILTWKFYLWPLVMHNKPSKIYSINSDGKKHYNNGFFHLDWYYKFNKGQFNMQRSNLPLSMRYLTTSLCPNRAAWCKHVMPYWSVDNKWAPLWYMSISFLRSPRFEASISILSMADRGRGLLSPDIVNWYGFGVFPTGVLGELGSELKKRERKKLKINYGLFILDMKYSTYFYAGWPYMNQNLKCMT